MLGAWLEPQRTLVKILDFISSCDILIFHYILILSFSGEDLTAGKRDEKFGVADVLSLLVVSTLCVFNKKPSDAK